MKILIVEDDAPIVRMYSMKLSSAGFEVKTAENGEQGLLVAERYMPDLILLDIKMPVMDGVEMLTILRAHEWASEMKVIILTNISKNEAPSKLRFLNIERYILKVHYTPQQVLEVVRETLS